MIDYNPLYKQLENTPLHNWIDELPKIIKWNLRKERYAHIPEWEAILDKLPELNPEIDLIESVTAYGQKTSNLRDLLMQLHPGEKAHIIYMIFTLIQNGDRIGMEQINSTY